jgi:hypothetical protein
MISAISASPQKSVSISCSEALRIAHADAQLRYRDLSDYRISVVLEGDAWQIDYELKDARLQGGGSHYVIDAESGQIREKRYEQ